jgi:hypothetical protein
MREKRLWNIKPPSSIRHHVHKPWWKRRAIWALIIATATLCVKVIEIVLQITPRLTK